MGYKSRRKFLGRERFWEKKKGSNYYMGEEKSVGQKAKHMNMEF